MTLGMRFLVLQPKARAVTGALFGYSGPGNQRAWHSYSNIALNEVEIVSLAIL
jgi:hypothetical protein